MDHIEKSVIRAALWSFVVIYVAAIFTGSVFARKLWESINYFTNGTAYIFILFVYAAAAILAVVWMAVIKRERSPERYFVLFLIGMAFLAMMLNLQSADERIHLAEFALLGAVVYYALKLDLPVHSRAIYFLAFMICAAVGILDEVVQSFVPGRVCDWRDMLVNVVSSLLALQAMRLFVSPRKAGK